jgi:glycerol-3-phosphate dehydrogenase (NAD(P)+)
MKNENIKFAVMVAEVSNGNYKMLCVNLSEVSWYMRNESAIEHINAYKHNPLFKFSRV